MIKVANDMISIVETHYKKLDEIRGMEEDSQTIAKLQNQIIIDVLVDLNEYARKLNKV